MDNITYSGVSEKMMRKHYNLDFLSDGKGGGINQFKIDDFEKLIFDCGYKFIDWSLSGVFTYENDNFIIRWGRYFYRNI